MSDLKLGIQLYTVRDIMKDDPKGVLKSLAEIGFKGVEGGARLGGMEPEEANEFLNGLGLQLCGSHMPLDGLVKPDSPHYDALKPFGVKYVTISLAHMVEKDWTGTIERVAEAGKVAATKGLTFTYHNHDAEFKKIAVVSDVSWIRHSVKLFAPLIPGQTQLFANADIDSAKEWISEN